MPYVDQGGAAGGAPSVVEAAAQLKAQGPSRTCNESEEEEEADQGRA